MPRSVHQILGLLGAKDPATILVYPLAAGDPPSSTAPDPSGEGSRRRRTGWASIWGADFGRMTAAVTPDEKDALVAAGARVHQHRPS